MLPADRPISLTWRTSPGRSAALQCGLLVFVILAALGASVAHGSVVLRYFRALRQHDGAIRVEWETASESDTTAFVLYRSENVNQVGISLTSIPARGDPVTGATYQHTDRDAQTGRIYYYRLQQLTSSGGGSWYGPVIPSGPHYAHRAYLPLIVRGE